MDIRWSCRSEVWPSWPPHGALLYPLGVRYVQQLEAINFMFLSPYFQPFSPHRTYHSDTEQIYIIYICGNSYAPSHPLKVHLNINPLKLRANINPDAHIRSYAARDWPSSPRRRLLLVAVRRKHVLGQRTTGAYPLGRRNRQNLLLLIRSLQSQVPSDVSSSACRLFL